MKMKFIQVCLFLFCTTQIFAQCFPDRHSTNWVDSWISCSVKSNPNPAQTESHWIMFDLNKQYRIDRFKIWNLNDPDRLAWGMQNIAIDYSKDSIVWNHAGTFLIDKASGNNRYEGMPWMDIIIPEARYVLITALSNYGGNCAGLSEILFSAEKVQSPVDVEDETFASEYKVDIKPNPFTDLLSISFSGEQGSRISYQIVDLLGKSQEAGFISLDNGFSYLKLSTRKWMPGSYLLITNDGKTIQRNVLVKM
ncbi:MAG: discoidin domain-containing protein [Saprospiraceae bacterium]|nr:discoidin domain-containing protein [Saprospiraceae bacterium]